MSKDYMNTDCCISCCQAGIKQTYKEMSFAVYYETKEDDTNGTYEIYYCRYVRGADEKEIIERLPAAIRFEMPKIIPLIFKIEKSYDDERFIPFWEKEAEKEQLNLFD